ncbi:MAG: hypothetical protein ABH865_00115 [Candidatus Omnitrophota bacterium]|nr:hypothetical protein [Candidatus Omnitrophota bacterium]
MSVYRKRARVSNIVELLRAKMQEGFFYYTQVVRKKHDSCGKFVICATPRSGSTLLVHMLNFHPSIHCEFEVLRSRPLFPTMYLEGRCASLKEKQVYGCKIMVHQITDLRYASSRDFLGGLNRRGWKIVVLNRRNIFMQAISSCVARVTGRWTSTAGAAPQTPEPVSIEYEYLLKKIEDQERWTSHQKSLLEGVPYLECVYEDDLLESGYHQKTADRIFAYLDLSFVPIRPHLERLLNKPLGELIENYSEIRDKIKRTRYAGYLVDCSYGERYL